MLEDVIFHVFFTSGSNMETEWFLDINDTCLLRHEGSPRHLRLTFTFSIPGVHNVTTVAANSVTRVFDSMLVEAVYRLNGINVDVDRDMSDGKLLVLKVRLSKDTDLPMGTMVFVCSFGDRSKQKRIVLNQHIPVMKSTGYILRHMYERQGSYAITAKLTSEVDKKVFVLRYDTLKSHPKNGKYIFPTKIYTHLQIFVYCMPTDFCATRFIGNMAKWAKLHKNCKKTFYDLSI